MMSDLNVLQQSSPQIQYQVIFFNDFDKILTSWIMFAFLNLKRTFELSRASAHGNQNVAYEI